MSRIVVENLPEKLTVKQPGSFYIAVKPEKIIVHPKTVAFGPIKVSVTIEKSLTICFFVEKYPCSLEKAKGFGLVAKSQH